jgi:HlyD family secretion protein
MKHRIVIIVIAILGVTASVAAYFRANGTAASPSFVTAAVTRGDVATTVEATGTLQAVTTVQVGTQVSGTIASLHADFNSRVKKGQVIARLDPSLLQAQVDQAEATVVRLQADAERSRVTLDDAQVKLRRARELFERQLIPALDVENADATVRQAEASLKASQAQVTQAQGSLNQARVNLNHTIITAPVDGIVISRSVDVGQTVAASMSAPTLFVIAKDLAEMQVNASIDESDIGVIKKGQRVSFRVDAYPGQEFRGTVSQVRLEPTVAQNVVSYVTVIDVPNRELKLKPGMTANVTVEVDRQNAVLRVPSAALRFKPEDQHADVRGPAVWVLQEGQLHAVPVRPGLSDGTTTAIVDGDLTEDAQVVTGASSGSTASAATRSTASPFMPQRPGGTRQTRQGGTR